MNSIIRPEREHAILGVDGRIMNAIADGDGLFVSQTWIARRQDGPNGRCAVKIRFDDGCRNGHQSFAITGTIYEMARNEKWIDVAGGCIHDDIARVFPELAPLIKWHLVSTDMPTHYTANPIYLAGNRDHWGLLKGERRQIRDRKTGLLAWKLTQVDDNGNEITGDKLPQYVDSATRPEGGYRVEYREWWRAGEGKARDLDAARRSAVWPDATDDELTADPETLKAALLARLPKLMTDFRAAMVDVCGFEWREVVKAS